jgi:hypothetical protein
MRTNNLRTRIHKKHIQKKIKKKAPLPHMEWDEEEDVFIRRPPHRSPKVEITASMMTNEHREFGVKCDARCSPKVVSAVADIGCQTTTSGIGILKELDIPPRYLIPTSHQIIGITDTSLRILGILLLKLKFNGRETKQNGICFVECQWLIPVGVSLEGSRYDKP